MTHSTDTDLALFVALVTLYGAVRALIFFLGAM